MFCEDIFSTNANDYDIIYCIYMYAREHIAQVCRCQMCVYSVYVHVHNYFSFIHYLHYVIVHG